MPKVSLKRNSLRIAKSEKAKFFTPKYPLTCSLNQTRSQRVRVSILLYGGCLRSKINCLTEREMSFFKLKRQISFAKRRIALWKGNCPNYSCSDFWSLQETRTYLSTKVECTKTGIQCKVKFECSETIFHCCGPMVF